MQTPRFQTPRFIEATPADCACGHCTAAPGPGRAGQQRCGTVRGAVVAAVGAAVLVGAASGAASAEPAPSHAGWDGSKYWYKDATGWWRWTSHYDKYVARGGKGPVAPKVKKASKGTGVSTGTRRSASASEPVFRGRRGWDATDRVYWYRKGGHWYWTSHQYKYERYAGRGTSATAPSTPPRPSTNPGTPRRHGTEAAVSYAMRHLGDPYVWGGNGPHGWDCSGLVMAAYRQAGIALPRVADAQYRATQPVSRGQLRRGDLVFWSSDGSASGVHHVAIYLGGGQYLEAPRPGRNVRVSSFGWYAPNLYGRVR
ncbi:C40 family peptidase [Streptomyces sp. NPDC020607]|uniref:C40 family peptidase n=1 Tax=Streptomyces sp. NPDC020607 TaxID=3365082 RepID=UPI003790DAF3